MFYFKQFFLTVVFLSCLFGFSQIITGKVVAIADGDTFKLLDKDSKLHKIRVANIDCPERKQPFSTKAKKFTSDAIFNKTVKINILRTDRYGRLIGDVIYNGSLNLSEELLKKGLAWHYVKYSKDPKLQSLENDARSKKNGLWQDPTSVAPWEWRANKKKIKSE
ncbi:thermonuclease family protein [Mariniflexile soesokkakense]|uniref:Thermonuclease family protein n=1 Tax=Mariniflexile soesokkakense TaxID=1343160 RepID=A0ABV0ABM4_9FLAO